MSRYEFLYAIVWHVSGDRGVLSVTNARFEKGRVRYHGHSNKFVRIGDEGSRITYYFAPNAEGPSIWQASFRLEGVTGPRFGGLVRFLLLTAQRRGEAAAMRHGDLLDGVWRQKENKANRPHRLRLPPLALDQIGSGQAQDRCFPGKGGTEMSGFSKLKAELDGLSGVSDWRLHDLRRTASSEFQELGVDFMVIEAVLNHAIAGAAGHYMHATLDRSKAEALQRWADQVQQIVGTSMRMIPVV